MTAEAILSALGQVDEAYVEEAAPAAGPRKKRRRMRWLAAAACLALAVGLGVFLGSRNAVSNTVDPTLGNIVLSDASRGVTVRYTDRTPSGVSSHSLVEYHTEEELFHNPRWEQAIFRGTVTGLNNIEIDFQGSKAYRAIAEISVDRAYLGDGLEGETVKVLLPCPISSGIWVEDTGVVSHMKVGMTGIFLPIAYDGDSYWGQNGVTLMLKDLADYGFADGQRYAFLETEKGLFYARHAYPGAAGARTLDEIEDYVIRMIEKTYP